MTRILLGSAVGIVVLSPALLLWPGGPRAEAEDLEPPRALAAGGETIDVEIGHAAPFIADFDGDGLDDLLVGQFGNGRLRIYRNTGSRAEPRYDRFQWFRAGEALGAIPAG